MDWDFTLFSAERLDRDHPYGLRRHRCFSSDRLYHYVIIADLVLRFSWLWRVLPGLAWLPESESGLFMLMFLEVVRRWMWVFFRAETEWGMFHCFTLMHLRFYFYLPLDSLTQFLSLTTVRTTRGPGPDDLLLGEYSHKLGAD